MKPFDAWGLGGAIVMLGALAGCADTPPEQTPEAEQAIMEEIAQAVTHALPLSLSPERLTEAESRARFDASVRTLSRHASRLEAHGRDQEVGFEYLSRSLASDARDALRRLEAGHVSEAQFIVQQLVDDCVACHARLPDPEDSALGSQLLQGVDLDQLDLREWARLATATRHFDAALEGYEELFASSALPPGQLDLQGFLVDYLVVCLRVKGDLRRAASALAALASRPDVPDYLEQDLHVWSAALRDLQARRDKRPPLEEARALIRESGLQERAAYDRGALMHALLASGLLHRYVLSPTGSELDLAEAYLLLGLTEARIRHSYWLSQADAYLEAAIRTAPGTPVAAAAYRRFEEETLAGFTGTSGLHLPEDVRLRLEELRALAEGR